MVDRLRPDVAIVAAAGRPNVDGEPIRRAIADRAPAARLVELGYVDGTRIL